MSETKGLVTDNFMNSLPDAVPEPTDKFDERNGVYVRNASFCVEAHLGYLGFLNAYVAGGDAYKYDEMLRLGYIPVIMPPSFWEKEVQQLMPKLPEDLPFVTTPSVSFVGRFYRSDFRDVWVSKLDAAKYWGWKPEEVTVRRIFAQCGI